MVEHKDVVLAILGASAGLSGLLLVFLGFVIGAYGGFIADTPQRWKVRLRRCANVSLLALGLGIACIATAASWLVELSAGPVLYSAVVVLFAVQLAGLVVATIWTMVELLWG